MPKAVIDQITTYASQIPQTFHVSSHIGVVYHREKLFPIIRTIFFYKSDSLWQQFDAGQIFILLSQIL